MKHGTNTEDESPEVRQRCQPTPVLESELWSLESVPSPGARCSTRSGRCALVHTLELSIKERLTIGAWIREMSVGGVLRLYRGLSTSLARTREGIARS